MIDPSLLKTTLYFSWLWINLYLPFFSFKCPLETYSVQSALASQKTNSKIFFFFSCSRTTFENTVGESPPQNVSCGKSNLVLIVIVPLVTFILEIAVVFGIMYFRRHQGHKDQGKFPASFFFLFIWKYCNDTII